MCTVTWVHHEDGYELLSNRDERLSRSPALPPQLQCRDGVRYLAPVDTDRGGTWIGVNELGLGICLLNGHGEPTLNLAGLRSRGLVLPELISAGTAIEVAHRFWRMDLTGFAPFQMAALEAGLPAAVLEWSGAARSILLRGEPYLPLCSSSFDGPGVQRERRRAFRRLMRAGEGRASEALVRFHASHGCGGGAYSPCMHRSDAETVSFSRVKVDLGTVEFSYHPQAPCRPGDTAHQLLPLRQ